MITWYVLTRNERPPNPGDYYPPEGFPLQIHADKERVLANARGSFKCVPVVPLYEVERLLREANNASR